jgi:hypothetical protein
MYYRWLQRRAQRLSSLCSKSHWYLTVQQNLKVHLNTSYFWTINLCLCSFRCIEVYIQDRFLKLGFLVRWKSICVILFYIVRFFSTCWHHFSFPPAMRESACFITVLPIQLILLQGQRIGKRACNSSYTHLICEKWYFK